MSMITSLKQYTLIPVIFSGMFVFRGNNQKIGFNSKKKLTPLFFQVWEEWLIKNIDNFLCVLSSHIIQKDPLSIVMYVLCTLCSVNGYNSKFYRLYSQVLTDMILRWHIIPFPSTNLMPQSSNPPPRLSVLKLISAYFSTLLHEHSRVFCGLLCLYMVIGHFTYNNFCTFRPRILYEATKLSFVRKVWKLPSYAVRYVCRIL